MNKVVEITPFKGDEIPFEDIVCVLNVVHSHDLKQILLMTPLDRRLEVALAFSQLSSKELFIKAGIFDVRHAFRWLAHENRLPLGAAFRMSKVLGVPSEILFESPKWRGDNDHKR